MESRSEYGMENTEGFLILLTRSFSGLSGVSRLLIHTFPHGFLGSIGV